MTSTTLLSIITITRNDEQGLGRTIDSVRNQSCLSGVEQIVIDGLSDDGTSGLLYNEAASWHALRFISERDDGIYDAMNKGLRLAKGEYSLFLNSGDTLMDSRVLGHLLPILSGERNEWVVGRILDLAGGNVGRVSQNLPFSQRRFLSGRQQYCHQGTIFRTGIIRELDGYQPAAGYAADADLMFQFNLIAAPREVDLVISQYQGGGISEDLSVTAPIEFHRFRVRHLQMKGFSKAASRLFALFQVSNRARIRAVTRARLFLQ
jgi:glycosyltransferase involved in cell wall biosynthesis